MILAIAGSSGALMRYFHRFRFGNGFPCAHGVLLFDHFIGDDEQCLGNC